MSAPLPCPVADPGLASALASEDVSRAKHPALAEAAGTVAVVVTFDRLEQLRLTLARLFETAPDRLHAVVVVDNASTDGTAEALAAMVEPRLDVLRLPANLGGAGGFEAGLAHAMRTHPASWYLVMDDDARPESGMLASFAPPLGADAVAAAVFLPSGAVSEMNRPALNPFWHPRVLLRTLWHGGREGFHLGRSDFAPDAPVRWVDTASFVGLFLSRAALEHAGLPEGWRYIYGDDLLYALHLRRRGMRIAFQPALRFEHDCQSFGPQMSYRPLWKIYYHARNGVDIARVSGGPVLFPALLGWYLALWLRRARGVPRPERRLYRRLLWMGLADGIRRRRGRRDEVHALATGS